MLDPIHPDVPEIPTTEYGETPNYKFLLSLKDSITSWLNYMNTNLLKIDTVMHELALRTSIDGKVPPEAIESLIQVEKELVILNSTVETHSNELDAIEQQLLNLQTLQADVSILKQNYLNLDTKVTAFETRLDSLQTSIAKLSTNFDSLEERVVALESS